MTWYPVFKSVHVFSITMSAVLFVTRGVWLIRDSDKLSRRWVRIAPHIVDTILLLSAIALVVQLHQYPFVHHWLTAKILALLVYIGLGLVVFRFARSRRLQVINWLGALVVLTYIIAVALTHSPTAGL
jgi:uncharacterized membrane protein SirB2